VTVRDDVGKDDDQSAAGHAGGAHLDHPCDDREAFRYGLPSGVGIGGQPPFNNASLSPRPAGLIEPHEFQDFLE